MNRSAGVILSFVFILLTIAAASAAACPNCYGDPNSTMAQGMNMAVVSLLGVTGGVLVAVGSFFLYLRKRARMMAGLFDDRLN